MSKQKRPTMRMRIMGSCGVGGGGFSKIKSVMIIFLLLDWMGGMKNVNVNVVDGFNLEPKLPVIKRGEPSSYFGFSVAQHLTEGSNVPW